MLSEASVLFAVGDDVYCFEETGRDCGSGQYKNQRSQAEDYKVDRDELDE